MLARQYALPEEDVRRLRDAFSACADTMKKTGNAEEAVRRVAEATLAPGAAEDVFRLGSFTLSFYLASKVSVHGKPLELEGAYWDDVRAQLKSREEKPAASGLIILARNSGLSPAP